MNTVSYIKHVSCCLCWHILIFKTQRPLVCPRAHASVAWPLGVWSESLWALKRSTPIIGASGVLLLSLLDGLGHQDCYSPGECPSLHSSEPTISPCSTGRVRLIRIYDAVSTTMECFTLLLISGQFSGSESYI